MSVGSVECLVGVAVPGMDVAGISMLVDVGERIRVGVSALQGGVGVNDWGAHEAAKRISEPIKTKYAIRKGVMRIAQRVKDERLNFEFKFACIRIGLIGVKQARCEAELSRLLRAFDVHGEDVLTAHRLDDIDRSDFLALGIVQRYFEVGALLKGAHVDVDAQACGAVVLHGFGFELKDAYIPRRQRDDAFVIGVELGEEKVHVVIGHGDIITIKKAWLFSQALGSQSKSVCPPEKRMIGVDLQ